ncbi:MAG TPA: metal-sensitive transcriptional regulator [Actinomycetota bacterium]|nr:metal-sensitive transcriptional regulator [Actinomycetota bacterium]
MRTEDKAAILGRLRTVRGHLDGIVRMVEEEAYCVELMKQISAVQASLERANRLILRHHLETCFSDAVRAGRGAVAVAELIDAVKFTGALTGPGAAVGGRATGEGDR